MNYVKNGIKIISFILLIVIIGYNIQNVLTPKFDSSQGARTGFFEEENNSIDVLFLGTSNMFHTINPLIIYEDTGITSFDFGSASQSLNMSYMYLKEALKTQSPKIVGLEVLASRDDFVKDLYEPGLRWGFTYFPLGINKAQGLYVQLRKIDSEYLSYLLPIIRYKDCWKELDQNGFQDNVQNQYWKGCMVSYKVTPVTYTDDYWTNIEWEIADNNLKYLDSIINLCRENNIEIFLYKAPTPTLWKDVYSQKIIEYANQKDVRFIDYNMKLEELEIDTNRDFMDAGHVNVYGSLKITKHLAQFLKDNFVLEDHRNGENNSWDVALIEKKRREYNKDLLNADSVECFINMIQDNDYTITYVIENNSSEYDEWNFLKENFSLQGQVGIIQNGEILFENSNEVDFIWHNKIGNCEYSFERLKNENSELESTKVYVDGKEYEVDPQGINFIIYDNRLDEMVGNLNFSLETIN